MKQMMTRLRTLDSLPQASQMHSGPQAMQFSKRNVHFVSLDSAIPVTGPGKRSLVFVADTRIVQKGQALNAERRELPSDFLTAGTHAYLSDAQPCDSTMHCFAKSASDAASG
jgi:hypothetical protein